MDDLISVIIPVFNVQDYLEECIQSITTQTYKNLEIIIVDDGSTDSCASICDSFAERDTRILVIHKINGGLSDARNSGLNIATGDYIAFVDSDDFIDNDMIEYLYKLLKANDAHISICGKRDFLEFPKYNNDLTGNIKEKVLQSQQALKLLIEDEVIQSYAWNKLYVKELFQEIRYPVGKVYEDLYTTYKLFYVSEVIVYSNLEKYNYRINPNGIVQSGKIKNEIDKVEASKEIYQFCSVNINNLENLALDRYLRNAIRLIRIIYSKNNTEQYMKELKSLFRKYYFIYLKTNDYYNNKLIATFTIINEKFAMKVYLFLSKLFK